MTRSTVLTAAQAESWNHALSPCESLNTPHSTPQEILLDPPAKTCPEPACFLWPKGFHPQPQSSSSQTTHPASSKPLTPNHFSHSSQTNLLKGSYILSMTPSPTTLANTFYGSLVPSPGSPAPSLEFFCPQQPLPSPPATLPPWHFRRSSPCLLGTLLYLAPAT